MQVYFTPYPSTRNNRNQWWTVIKIKPQATIETAVEDTAFQEDTNDNPPTLCALEENQEADIHSEDIAIEEDDEGDSSVKSDGDNLEGEREGEGGEGNFLYFDADIDEDIAPNGDDV